MVWKEQDKAKKNLMCSSNLYFDTASIKFECISVRQ